MDTKQLWNRVKRQIQRNVDLVLVVLDARDPLGTRPTRIEQFIQKWGATKNYLLVLNKIDMVPREVVSAWARYFQTREEGVPFLLFSGKKGTGYRRLQDQIYRYVPRNKAKVMVVGYPNTGKSTIINVLLQGKKRVGTSSQAGFTRGLQLVKLAGPREVYLVDSPGIIPYDQRFSELDLALKGAKVPNKLKDPLGVVEELFYRRVDHAVLRRVYEVSFTDLDDFITALGKKRGRLQKGGTVNERQVYLEVIQDWQTGKIPFYTRPPESERDAGRTIK